jgi:site-specific DNA-methyltransferase (cytosine-N4-specific)
MAFGSNMRNYWVLGPEPFAGEHFAVFPTEIPNRCILAGSKAGDIVLDPFMGVGTTALIASRLNRKFLGIELNPQFIEMAEKRISLEMAQGKFL